MSSVNSVTLLGRLTRDPEIRYTQDNKAVANLTVVTSEKYKDKSSGDLVEKPEFHKVVLFGSVAEIAEKYLKKGSQAYYCGKLQTRKWQDKDGNDHYSTEIVVDRGGVMQLLGGKPSNDNNDDFDKSRFDAPDDDNIPF